MLTALHFTLSNFFPLLSFSLSLWMRHFTLRATNTKPKCNSRTAQSPHWHPQWRGEPLFTNSTQLSILFHSVRHVRFSHSSNCWQFSNSSFHSAALFCSYTSVYAPPFRRQHFQLNSLCSHLWDSLSAESVQHAMGR